MGTLLKLAFRNLREHWVKTLILGIIIFNSVWVLLVSTSFLGMAQRGIKTTFVNNFTGEVIVKAKSIYPYSLFGVQAPGGIEENPQIPDLKEVQSLLLKEEGNKIESYTMLVTGGAAIRFEDQKKVSARGFGLMTGVDGDSYFKLFTGHELVEGSFLKSGEPGLMISQPNRDELREALGHRVEIGDMVKLTGLSNAGPRIREVPLVGVFTLGHNEDERNYICYVDIQTMRALKSMNLSASENVQVDSNKIELMDSITQEDSLDDLFGDDDFLLVDEEEDAQEFNEDDFFALFDDLKVEKAIEQEVILTDEEKQFNEMLSFADISEMLKDHGPREFILIKLKPHVSSGFFISRINRKFSKNSLAVQAGNWKEAAGFFAGMADLIVVLYSIVILMVIVIAFFIVINTLVISVVQRKREIGTMRALGAQRTYIASLFTIETVLIGVIFTVIGILFAIFALWVVGMLKIEATNSLFLVIFDGPILKPVVTVSQFLFSSLIVLIITILSNLIPLRMAMQIQPVEAMRE